MSASIIATQPIWSDWDATGGAILLYAPGDVIPADVAKELGVTKDGTRTQRAYAPPVTVTETAAPAKPKAAPRKGRTARSAPTETREGTPE